MKMVRPKAKKSHAPSKLILEEIIGLTTTNANGLASNISSKHCVYMAGCVVVVYNVETGKQSHLMVSCRQPKPLSCVAISKDGRFAASGESGHQPAVLIWDCTSLVLINELKGHQHGVACIAFSPTGKHLVSVGFPHDGYMCLWDWRSGMLIRKLKASSSCSAISSVSFSSDANFIVTVGKKHLKFWTVSSSTKRGSNNAMGSIAMYGKPIILGSCKSSFVCVSSPCWNGNGVDGPEHGGGAFPVYALTDEGFLCILRPEFPVQSVDLKVKKGFSLCTSNKLIACGCSNGIVQLFTIESFKFCGSLQYSESKHPQKACNMVWHATITEKDSQLGPSLPDAIACQFSSLEKLVIVYGDHSLYVWDIQDVTKPTKCCVLVSHSACIWDIKNLSCDYVHDPSVACIARGCSGGVSFATCSADCTIRLWDLALQPYTSDVGSSKPVPSHQSLCTESSGTTHLVSAGIFERDSVESSISPLGFRSMAVSSDGNFLAAGDCQGNLHIYNLQTSEFECFQNVHDAEILSLSFSSPSKKDFISEKDIENHHFLVSGGRDRSIHLYDVRRNFNLIDSIADHSAAVTSVKLACAGRKIISCSADRSLVFRDVAMTDNGCKILRRHHQLASHGTVYDMTIDPRMEVAVTVGQDKKIKTFHIAAGKLIKTFKQDGDLGEPTKVTVDPSCSYLLCTYSNKSVCLYDFINGEMVAQAMGHGDVITGVIFLPDFRHIISVSGDGCIFVWKVPAPLSSRMQRRMKKNSSPMSPTCIGRPIKLDQIIFRDQVDSHYKINREDLTPTGTSRQVHQRVRHHHQQPQGTPTFKFSISRLPRWAQTKLARPEIVTHGCEIASIQQEQGISSSLLGNSVGHGSLFSEFQTPSKHVLEDGVPSPDSISSRSNFNSSSSGSHGSISVAMDNRWLTIYNVCLDLPYSPGPWDLNGIKMMVPARNSLQESAGKMTSNAEGVKISLWDHNHVVNVKHGGSLNEHARVSNSGSVHVNKDQVSIHGVSACSEVLDSSKFLQRLLLDTNVSLGKAKNVRSCYMEPQNSNMSIKKVGNFSAGLKIEKRKPSARRCFSAQVVHQGSVEGCKKLFGTPIQKSGCEVFNSGEQCASRFTSEYSSVQLHEGWHGANAHKQDQNNSTLSLPKDTLNMGVTNVRCRNECKPGETEMDEKIIACKEALLNLDIAADNALKLFSTLATLVSREEILGMPGAHLYAEAADLLTAVTQKVITVAKLVQPCNGGSCAEKGEASGSEPLLET